MFKLPMIIRKRHKHISTGRVHMCILDRNGTTDRQGTPMDYADRSFNNGQLVNVVEHLDNNQITTINV